MVYAANKHNVFSDRMMNWFKTFQSLRDELERLDEIYIHETAYGADSAFDDTTNATKQEHIDGVVFLLALRDFVEGGVVPQIDRRPNITVFIQ